MKKWGRKEKNVGSNENKKEKIMGKGWENDDEKINGKMKKLGKRGILGESEKCGKKNKGKN